MLGLIITLVFNTLGVWFQLGEARQSKDVSQLGLVTELNTIAQQAEEKINATDLPDKRCDDDQTEQLRDREQAALAAALKNYDYLAWLFARDHVTLADANDYLAPAMIDAYEFGGVFVPAEHLARDYPNLKRFRDSAPKRLWPPDVCPR